MRKIICFALSLLLVFGICGCGKKETPIYGPFSMTDGKIGLEGVSMGDSYDDAKSAIEGKYPGTVEAHISSEDRYFEVFADVARESGGISYNYLHYSAGLKENTIEMMSMGFQHEEMDDSLLNDVEKLKKTVDDFFAPYRSAAAGMENVLITPYPRIEYLIDENGNREDMVFSYDGNEIYTMVFVDGQPVKVSSRSEAANIDGATILEIKFYAEALTQSDIDFYIRDDMNYMGGLWIDVTALPAEMLP